MFLAGPLGPGALSTVNPARGGRSVPQGREGRPARLYAHEDLPVRNQAPRVQQ